MKKSVCKICRRVNQKLFLKGEKCFSPKCPLLKKPYAPGQKAKKRRKGFSEYGKELIEKQKMRAWYGVSETQFKKYVNKVLTKRGKVKDASLELVKILEKRLDNVVFRLGFASSRAQARQLVTHRNFLINNRAVNIPSFQVKKGDVISLKEQKKEKTYFKKVSLKLAKTTPPSWLELDKKKGEGKVTGEPNFDEAGVPAEIPSIFEFYSR